VQNEEEVALTIERCLRISGRHFRPVMLARRSALGLGSVKARPVNRRTIGNFQRPLLDDSQKEAAAIAPVTGKSKLSTELTNVMLPDRFTIVTVCATYVGLCLLLRIYVYALHVNALYRHFLRQLRRMQAFYTTLSSIFMDLYLMYR